MNWMFRTDECHSYNEGVTNTEMIHIAAQDWFLDLIPPFTYQLKSKVYYENYPIKWVWGIYLRGKVAVVCRLPPTNF